jgi:hypothetical protein
MGTYSKGYGKNFRIVYTVDKCSAVRLAASTSKKM